MRLDKNWRFGSAAPIFSKTIPAKIQSYMASGRPIVTMLNGEGSRIIEEAHAGITCPAESPDSLASAVLELYRLDEKRREQMGKNARIYYEKHFERSMLFNRLEDWFHELVPVSKTKEVK